MKSRLLILAAVAVIPATFIAASCGGPESSPEFAPVRAYAGFRIDWQDWPGLGATGVITVGAGTPAEKAGIREGDVVRKVGGRNVLTGQDVYAQIEKKRPGQAIEIEVDRIDFSGVRTGSPLPDPEKLTFKIDLLEEPAPGTDYVWTPWTGLTDEDQARLGAYLADVTKPLALHFGIDQPGGVLVYMPLPIWLFQQGLVEADVIKSFDGKTVTSLKQLQTIVDKTPDDRAIKIGVRRGNQALEFTLDSLGPKLPGVNHLPAPARFRLKAALERGDLHQHHVQLIATSYRRTDPAPGESTVRNGTIKKLSESSITIELYETGTEWTLAVLPTTMVTGYGAPNGFADLNVGEFVQVFSRGDTAGNINSKSAPLF